MTSSKLLNLCAFICGLGPLRQREKTFVGSKPLDILGFLWGLFLCSMHFTRLFLTTEERHFDLNNGAFAAIQDIFDAIQGIGTFFVIAYGVWNRRSVSKLIRKEDFSLPTFSKKYKYSYNRRIIFHYLCITLLAYVNYWMSMRGQNNNAFSTVTFVWNFTEASALILNIFVMFSFERALNLVQDLLELQIDSAKLITRTTTDKDLGIDLDLKFIRGYFKKILHFYGIFILIYGITFLLGILSSLYLVVFRGLKSPFYIFAFMSSFNLMLYLTNRPMSYLRQVSLFYKVRCIKENSLKKTVIFF